MLFGASLLAFSRSHTFWLSFALLVPTGFGFMVQMASTNTLLQSMSPEAMRGRVMSVYAMMFMGTAPMGALLAGALAARIGPAYAVGFGGACTLVAALAFLTRMPKLRRESDALIASLHRSSERAGAE